MQPQGLAQQSGSSLGQQTARQFIQLSSPQSTSQQIPTIDRSVKI